MTGETYTEKIAVPYKDGSRLIDLTDDATGKGVRIWENADGTVGFTGDVNGLRVEFLRVVIERLTKAERRATVLRAAMEYGDVTTLRALIGGGD